MIASSSNSFGRGVRNSSCSGQSSHSFRAVAAACVTGMLLVAAGCDKYTDSGQTVGQKLDGAIDKTNAEVAAVGDSVGKKVDQVSSAVTGTGESISLSTGELYAPHPHRNDMHGGCNVMAADGPRVAATARRRNPSRSVRTGNTGA